MERKDSPSRRIVQGPSGRWRATPAADTAEERQKRQDRIALANHLTGFTAPRMKLQ